MNSHIRYPYRSIPLHTVTQAWNFTRSPFTYPLVTLYWEIVKDAHLTLISSKTEFLLIGLKKQLDKIHNSSLNTTHSARNLGFIFDEHLTFSDQISAISKACYYHIRQLRCIRPYLDSTTACAIATSIVHSKLNYCNSLYYNLPKPRLPASNWFRTLSPVQLFKAPKSCHITPVLRSLHWLKITERIEYKLLSLTYKK